MVERRAILPLLLLVAEVMCRSGQPNVLLIIVDDLRPALGCYGDSLAFTPHIDAIANRGTVFTRAYAQQALCGPSRTSFLTSRRPDTTQLYDVHSYWRKHAGNFTTLPQYFKEHGYHTVAAGKVFHPGIVSNHSDDQPYSWSETPYHPPTQAHKQDPVCLGADGALHTNIYCPVDVHEQPGGSLPDIETTRHSTAWLEKWAERSDNTSGRQSATQPFFLAVGYHKPHIPLKFPKQFLEFFPIASMPLAPNRWLPKGLPPVAWNPWNDLRWRDDIAALNVSFPYGPMPDFYARYIRQGYYAATTYTDSLIGDLLATVDRLFPDTIVAFIGDHGWSLGEHQEWSKFSNFEVSTRVPFIVRNWKQPQTEVRERRHLPPRSRITRGSTGEPRKYSGLVELVDLFPTLVDLAGLPTLPQCPSDSQKVLVCTEGASLSQIVNGDLWRTDRHAGSSQADGRGERKVLDSRMAKWSVVSSLPLNPGHLSRFLEPAEGNWTAITPDTNHESIETSYEPKLQQADISLFMKLEEGDRTAVTSDLNHENTEASHKSKSREVITSDMNHVNAQRAHESRFRQVEVSMFTKAEEGDESVKTSNMNYENTQTAPESRLREGEMRKREYMQRREITAEFPEVSESYDMPFMLAERKEAFSALEEAETHTRESRHRQEMRVESHTPSTSLITPPILAEKKAAFSQYPRPGPTPSRDPDSDQPPTRDTTIMGYSVRTHRFRFTAWLKFDNHTYRPDWNHIIAEELYDHKIDPAEDHNVIRKRSYARKREAMLSVLQAGWRSAVRWR